jgi:hypothetical protein
MGTGDVDEHPRPPLIGQARGIDGRSGPQRPASIAQLDRHCDLPQAYVGRAEFLPPK